jgi:uncharacterized protein
MGLFRRAKESRGQVRLYYASDIHGTEVLWRKFLHAPSAYRARVLVMGGDVTGKAVVPVIEEESGYTVDLFGISQRATTPQEVEVLEHRIRANGMYPHRMSRDEVARVAALPEGQREEWFAAVMRETLDRWLALAEQRLADPEVRCFVMPGNDDPPGVEAAIEDAARVEACDDRVVQFGPYTMLSLGYSNITPFDSPRELTEEELYRRIEVLAVQVEDLAHCVFNLHVPPFDSGLDAAPELDGELNVLTVAGQPKMAPCGSTAVREAIEHYQPLASLHGHVHESRGATHIGDTLCINPGSDYYTGRISGCLVYLDDAAANYQFVSG